MLIIFVRMETRSKDTLCSFDGLIFSKRDAMDLSVLQQLPTHRYFYERYLTLMTIYDSNDHVKANDLCEEFTYIWTHMNIPFLSRKSIVGKFEKLLKEFRYLRYRPDHERKSKSYLQRFESFSNNLEVGLDIFSEGRIEVLTADLGIEYEDDEKKLLKDNCKLDENGICPRIRWCGGVDKVWQKKATERKKKLEKKQYLAAKKMETYRQTMERLADIHTEIKNSTIDSSNLVTESYSLPNVDAGSDEDNEYQPSKSSYRMPTVVSNVQTRPLGVKTRSSNSSPVTLPPQEFPDIPVRTGYKTFNIDIMEALVVMEAVFKVDARKARQLLAFVSNKVFKQKWTVADEKKSKVEDEIIDDDGSPVKKKPRKLGNLDYQLPDRVTVSKYLSDFSLLSYTDMAESIVNAAAEDKSVTYGVDDTVKAAGFRKFDVKTMHVTILDEEKNR